jgi:hypothetical protein
MARKRFVRELRRAIAKHGNITLLQLLERETKTSAGAPTKWGINELWEIYVQIEQLRHDRGIGIAEACRELAKRKYTKLRGTSLRNLHVRARRELEPILREGRYMTFASVANASPESPDNSRFLCDELIISMPPSGAKSAQVTEASTDGHSRRRTSRRARR